MKFAYLLFIFEVFEWYGQFLFCCGRLYGNKNRQEFCERTTDLDKIKFKNVSKRTKNDLGMRKSH